jgi:hypothetical protein
MAPSAWRQPGVRIPNGIRLCDSSEEGLLSSLPLTNALNRCLGIKTLTQMQEGGIRFPGALVPMLLRKACNIFHILRDDPAKTVDALSSLNNGNPMEIRHVAGVDLVVVGKYSNHDAEAAALKGALSAKLSERQARFTDLENVQRDPTRKVEQPIGNVHLKLLDAKELKFYSDWPKKGDGAL